jgi:type II secretory pathway pseudopilin PulG
VSGPVIDFLRLRPRGWIGWGLLALGAAALGGVLLMDRQWSQERHAREAAARELASLVEQRRRDAMRPLVQSPENRRLQQVAPQLRQPWLPVLRVIESTTRPPVYLLALAIDPGSGTVRVEGETPSFSKALEFAKALDQERLLGPAELRSHEQVADAEGRVSVRFTVVTRWSAR